MMIHPDLYQEIARLSDLLRAKFSPPEFIPGCQVKSVADVSLYATNNGWIEAICGQHNQQRVRWKSNETVAVNDYIDVLYFPDRRLFEAYGLGGTAAIAAAVAGGSSDPNAFLNGALQFWQRGTSFAAVANLTRVADGFKYAKVGAMVHTVSESTDVPTIAEIGVKLGSSMLIDCTTVDAAIDAGDVCVISRAIEGYNFLNLTNGFTISFWVKGTKTGIHCIAFENSGGDRSYIAEYTINTTATWERKTVTVPATPTAGTWSYTTSAGLWISWALAVGSTFQTTADAWQTGHFYGTSNQVNACDDTANDFRITGIKIEPGASATPFLLPDFQQEYERCQRYTWVMPAQRMGLAITADALYGGGGIVFPTLMRATPTMTNATFTVNAGSAGTPTLGSSSAHGLAVANSAANWTVNAIVDLAATFSAEF